jgi:hypothetical protein
MSVPDWGRIDAVAWLLWADGLRAALDAAPLDAGVM